MTPTSEIDLEPPLSVSVCKLQQAILPGGGCERRRPVESDAHPPVAAPPLGGLCESERPLQVQLRPEGLAEDEVDERIQADVEHRQQDGHLLQVEEGLAPGAALPQEGVGKTHEVVRDEADAEHAHQNQHVSARLSQLLGAGGRDGKSTHILY